MFKSVLVGEVGVYQLLSLSFGSKAPAVMNLLNPLGQIQVMKETVKLSTAGSFVSHVAGG